MRSKIYSCIFSLFLAVTSNSQPPAISYQTVVAGLSAPIDVVNASDGSNRLFVVQQGGLIRIWNGTTLTDFLNVGATGLNLVSTNASERGLLSMVFHPDYNGTSNRFFFIYYTDVNGDIAIRRFETTVGNINTVDLASGLLIITIAHPGETNHNGGKLNFGTDGYLYFATGDGGGANDVPNNAQNGSSLLGKMIRIDINNTNPPTYPNYAVPAGNPYTSDPAIDDRIWSLGLRNPFRWSFDRLNGNMWIGDVGQGAQEEINFRPAANTGGVNFGWRCYEGYISTPGVADCTPANYIPPVYDYPNVAGPAAVTGGYVYRGTEYPNFRGYYVATDVYSGSIYILWPNGSGGFDSSVQAGGQTFIVGFGEAEDGTLYAVSQGTNTLYKVVATGGIALPVTLTAFSAAKSNGFNELKWTTGFEQATAKFIIEWSRNGTMFEKAGEVAAARIANGTSYRYLHHLSLSSTVYYRLAVEDDDGSVRYSSILKLDGDGKAGVKVYPTVITNHTIQLSTSEALQQIQLIGTNGAVVFKQNLEGFVGSKSVTLPSVTKGVYVVRLIKMNGGVVSEKIVIE